MTEDAAKVKWCPHAIASHTDPRQIVNGHWLHHCIGSACMAWRWIDLENFAPIHEEPTDKTDGYCGLAGAPQ